MTKKSLLIINRVYPPHRGATGRMAENLARHMASQGWDVQVLTTGAKKYKGLKKDIFVHSIKVNQEPRSVVSYLSIFRKLLTAALFSQKPDVVVSMSDPPLCAVMGHIVSKVKGAKHIHWSHDVYPDLLPLFGKRPPVYNSVYKYMRRILNRSSKVVVLERCMADYLVKTGVNRDKVSIIPNWADPHIFIPEGTGKIAIQPKTVLPEKVFRDDSPKFRILYAGNVGLAHDMRVIFNAAKKLLDHKEIEFVFVGTSDAHDDLAQERAKEGLDNIKFMPYQPSHALKGLLESGDIHLVSMKQGAEGLLLPCKFYSSLAVGRPTIFVGSEKSGIAKVLKEYKAGITVSNDKAQSLVDAILYYRHNGQEWFNAQEGAIKASQTYNITTSLNAWSDELNRAVK
ncbi:MAG: glycosyltransferase family 4 protein [Alphaproteobacteria bacterium]|nr:glycosyltransferase family 4 protein [Alphaproteobacteria bacterium]